MKSIVPILSSSAELVSELQMFEGGDLNLGQSRADIQDTDAIHVSNHVDNEETCAITFSIPPNQTSFSRTKTFRRPK